MARPTLKDQEALARARLQPRGFAACAAGVALLLLPLLTGQVPLIAAWAMVLTGLGGLTLVLGVVLLVRHYSGRPALSKSEASPAANGALAKLRRRSRQGKSAGTARTDPQWSGAPSAEDSAAQAAEAAALAASLKRPCTWSAEVFAAMEWRRFEAVCEALFAQPGLETLSESHGPKGGVDLWLHSRNAKGPVAVVRCKQWQGKAVGVNELSALSFVMAAHQLMHGTHATTSTYTPDARQFAKAHSIELLDGADLLKRLATRSQDEQQTLLLVAFSGEYWRPTCASCGTKMVERTPSNGGPRFWGCSDYPHCKLRLPMVDNLRELSLLVK